MAPFEVPDWLTPGTGMAMPGPGAPWATWASYAASRGMPPGMAEELSRDEIRVLICPPGVGASAVNPVMERHERDPEALASRRASRAKPWERA